MLCNYITPGDIKLNLESTEVEECFAELLEVIVAKNPHLNRKEALQALESREEKSSTAVFPQVAIPHAICKSLNKSSVAIGISRRGVEFDSPVNIVFEILIEENDAEFHMNILKSVVELVSNKTFVNKVLNAKSEQEVFNIIVEFETSDN